MATPEEIKIKELEEKADSLNNQLREVHKEIKKLKQEIIAKKHGVSVGSIVSRSGHEFKVTSVMTEFFSCDNKPWLRGVMRKKNGEFSTQERSLYNEWELVDEEDNNEKS